MHCHLTARLELNVQTIIDYLKQPSQNLQALSSYGKAIIYDIACPLCSLFVLYWRCIALSITDSSGGHAPDEAEELEVAQQAPHAHTLLKPALNSLEKLLSVNLYHVLIYVEG